MTKIRAIAFDMDGVLIDAKEWHYEALNRALTLFGYSVSRYDHLVTYDGLPTRKKLEMLTKEQGLPAGLHPFLNRLKQDYTMDIVHAKCRPLFQHEYALSRLKADGYSIAVASNSIRDTIEVMMRRANLTQYLSAIISNQDVTHGKPDPAIYLTTFERLAVSPDECLVVEDNEHGIRAAQDAGAHLLVVADVHEVTHERIRDRINQIEGAQA